MLPDASTHIKVEDTTCSVNASTTSYASGPQEGFDVVPAVKKARFEVA